MLWFHDDIPQFSPQHISIASKRSLLPCQWCFMIFRYFIVSSLSHIHTYQATNMAIDSIYHPDTVAIESTAGGIKTPTTEASGETTTIDEWLAAQGSHSCHLFGTLKVVRNAEPEVKQIFLLIDKSTSRALTCHDGQLRLESGTRADPHWQWRCATKNGHFGLENVAEGGFIGHDIWWNIHARAKSHRGWEYLAFEKRVGGGYWVKALHWWTYYQLSVRADNSELVAEKSHGTLWEFVRVKRD